MLGIAKNMARYTKVPLDSDVQKRVATPAEAIRNGADYLVIGRQITRAADPAAEAARVLEEVEQAGAPSASPVV